MAPNATDDAPMPTPSPTLSAPSLSSSSCSAKCNPSSISLREQMLRESFDLINGHLERSVPGNAPQISTADGSSLSSPWAYVSSGSSSSSSSPVPPSPNNNNESSTSRTTSTTSDVQSRDQEEEEDEDITDKDGTHHEPIAYTRNLGGKNAPRKTDVASSKGNDTDETAESSHDDRNGHENEESVESHSEDELESSGESSSDDSEDEELFADDAYIQTDEVTLSADDLERLRSLRPHGGGMVTTIPTKRTASCMEAPDMPRGKEIRHDVDMGKRPRLALDVEQTILTQSHHQVSSRRRPSASRSA